MTATESLPELQDPFSGKQWFEAKVYAKPTGVDRDAGAIYGCSIVTSGPALGHGVSLDSEFVSRVVELGNAERGGLKGRFGHPNMCSTALGTFLGRWKNFRVDGSRALADIFLSGSAKKTPNGDLYGYVVELAAREPDMFGVSIVFTRGKTYKRNGDGEKVYHPYDVEDEQTVSESREQRKAWDSTPGPVFIECGELHSADVVDEPAANPGGLFSRWSNETLAGQVTQFLDTHPEVLDLLDAHPEVFEDFRRRYAAHKLLSVGGQDMAEEATQAADAATSSTDATAPAGAAAEEHPAATPAGEAPVAPEGASQPAKPDAGAATTATDGSEPQGHEDPPAESVGLAVLSDLVERYGADVACEAILAGGGELEAAKIALAKTKAALAAAQAGKPGSGRPAAWGEEDKPKPTMFPHLKR